MGAMAMTIADYFAIGVLIALALCGARHGCASYEERQLHIGISGF